MHPYQSSLYQLTESVGAVSMVNTDQIKKQQNLDYLEHLCCFIERMNINPIWFENQEPPNKLKILEIYQLAINYSRNLSQSYRKEIEDKETVISGLRKAEKDKVAAIRNQKEEYLSMKEKYKVKKHQMYRYMYDNLKNKIREEEQEREYRRVDHHRRQATATATPEIVYYYPNDPNYHQYAQYPPNYMHPPSIHSQPGNPYPNQQFPPLWNPQSGPPTENMNNAANNPYFLDPNNRQHQASQRGQSRPQSYRYTQFLNTGELQSGSNKIPQVITTKDVIQASQEKQKEQIEKSNIIESGEKLIQKIGKDVKQTEKSNRSNASKKKESVRLDSRQDDEDFGDLTVNSKKRDSIKAVEKNADVEQDQEQFDSIAHIKLVSDSSAKVREVAPNRFQSRIQAASPKAQSTTKKESEVSPNNLLNVEQSDSIKEMGFSSSIMHSKFSKNNKQAQQVQKLLQQPPKRNSQTIQKSNLPPQLVGKQDDLRQSNQSSKAKEATQPFQTQRLNNVKPKRNTQPRQQNQKAEEVSIVQAVDISDQNFDIYHSNAGKVESRKFQKPKTQDSVNILNSNVGYASGNSKAEPIEKLNLQKPKRASQIQAPILEVPEPTKSSGNTLKVSVAESEQMRNSNMLYSQAVSMKFSKEPSKTPPKLQKQSAQKHEQQEYMDGFDEIDDFQVNQLEQSHLPISNNRTKPAEKSEVEINVPTNKEIVNDKYLKLTNEVFELKNPNQLVVPNKIGASVAASSNLGQSDSFFDEILEIPMNSRIAKRPSVIHKFQPSKINKTKTVESLKKIPQQKNSSMSNINSPSIRIIDPTGNVQRVQQRGTKQQQRLAIDNNPKQNIKASIKLQQFSGKSVVMKGKQTSLLLIDPPQIKQEVERVRTEEEEEINFNLIEKSNIGNNSYQKEGIKKILDLINKIETQSPTIRDARTFNDNIFDKILKDRMKVGVNTLKTPQRWEQVQVHFKKQLEKVKSQLDERRSQERSEEVSTPNSRKKESFYDDLVYSQSNAKFQEKSSKKELAIDPVKDLTQSITIKDPPVIQEKPAPKNTADNKYSRSNKPKVQIKNEIRKNINQGKNAYDVDDPLNAAVYQNKNLFEKRQEDQDSDF